MKEVYLPAFRAIGERQYIFSLCKPICKLFNDAVLDVTITILFKFVRRGETDCESS
jgi:hypothetical protein